MHLPRRGLFRRAIFSLLGVWLSAATAGGAWAQGTERLRIVGGLGALNQYTRHEVPFWTQELPRLSGGRYSAEIVPFDRAGIRGQETLSLVKLGVVPFATVLLSAIAAKDPELAAPDLAGLNPDMKALRRSVAVFRPYLESLLRERYGVDLLAVYVYPAQMTFCKAPLAGLSALAGRRVRTSSPTQADFVEALGGVPVSTGFSEILPQIKAGHLDCAITGSMSGHTVGLHDLTSHLQTTAITWGLSVFVANGATWAALPADLRALLKRELPRVEQAVWLESEQETGAGVACSTGTAACASGAPGRMVAVAETAADRARLREIVQQVVLPRWAQRCGAGCASAWSRTLGPVTGLSLPPGAAAR